jgi:plasmid stabilization system protein ParE
MKVVFTAAAQNDLRDIGEWLATRYPVLAPHVERRIRNVVVRIGRWPEARHLLLAAATCGSYRQAAIRTRFSVA